MGWVFFEGGHLDPIIDIIIILKITIIIIFKGGHRVQGERRTWTGHFVSSSCCHQDVDDNDYDEDGDDQDDEDDLLPIPLVPSDVELKNKSQAPPLSPGGVIVNLTYYHNC